MSFGGVPPMFSLRPEAPHHHQEYQQEQEMGHKEKYVPNQSNLTFCSAKKSVVAGLFKHCSNH